MSNDHSPRFRIGQGFDVHAFGPGDHVMLGGIRVPHTQGVEAHSDGDVVIHALCDAIYGALAEGDEVVVRRAARDALLVQLGEPRFYDRLREKLKWGMER